MSGHAGGRGRKTMPFARSTFAAPWTTTYGPGCWTGEGSLPIDGHEYHRRRKARKRRNR